MPSAERTVDVLLVGGGVASVRCARTLRRGGFAGSILLVGDEDRAPYNRPPLSKELLRADLPDDLLAAEPASFYERRSVELQTGSRVAAIDPDTRRATFADGVTVAFERCLLATGAELRRLSIPGAEQALMLRTASDARRLRAAAIAAPRGASAVVIGGGFIGLEVASALAVLGLRPTVVELAASLWGGTLGRRLADWAAGRLSAAGIELRLASAATRLADGAVWLGEERVPAALVVAGIGVLPRADLAASAGIATGDGILCDDQQRTSHSAIWAAGDVARVDGRRVEHWHSAREAGERAAHSMLGHAAPPPPPAWVFSEIAGSMVDVIGAVERWDEERWLMDGRLLAYLAAERVVGLASIEGALPAEAARQLLAAGASIDVIARAAA
jgi:NADPH-dependent 2,4-dienoyl-CoA reductase/sulfur reductase-like enzyme